MASNVAVNDSSVEKRSWRGLLIQPTVIVMILICFVVWLLTAQLSSTERETLSPANIWFMTVQHIQLTVVSAFIVIVVAVPLGILLTRGRLARYSGPIIAVANVGQAAPAVGLIVLLALWLGLGFWSAIVALVLYSLLPVLRNTMIGLQQVDRSLIEAARGMGMPPLAVLVKVELPLAVPVMLAGIRTALVLLVGTAALATFINGGGLGLLITTGVSLFLPKVLISGALLVALLALIIDWAARVFEHFATPRGLQ